MLNIPQNITNTKPLELLRRNLVTLCALNVETIKWYLGTDSLVLMSFAQCTCTSPSSVIAKFVINVLEQIRLREAVRKIHAKQIRLSYQVVNVKHVDTILRVKLTLDKPVTIVAKDKPANSTRS
jgi:hypothetical protein